MVFSQDVPREAEADLWQPSFPSLTCLEDVHQLPLLLLSPIQPSWVTFAASAGGGEEEKVHSIYTPFALFTFSRPGEEEVTVAVSVGGG
jgi:hypothetical protein